LTSLVKGPRGEQKLLDASTAHQIFGRAGRPQFDDRGYVYAMAHEDDVKILRWKQKYDAIPEDTKDPGLLKAKKALKKKRPTRRETETYWNEAQFEKLKGAPPGKLYSKGPLPWRLLAYLLKLSPEVGRIRNLIGKRLMDEPRIKAGEIALDRMLLSLAAGGYVKLEPEPPAQGEEPPRVAKTPAPPAASGLLLGAAFQAPAGPRSALRVGRANPVADASGSPKTASEQPARYSPTLATPTDALDRLLPFRSMNPLYGAFLIEQMGVGDRTERLQALESVLGLPRPLLKYVRVPFDLPPGPLATTRLDFELIQRGLIAAPLPPDAGEDEEDDRYEQELQRPPTLAEKLRLLFDAKFPEVTDVETQSGWCAGELLTFGGNFNNYVKARDLVKQEGIVVRHLLRLILLCEEFSAVTPAGMTPEDWQAELRDLAERLTASCRAVDPTSTEEAIQHAHAADLVEGEEAPTDNKVLRL